MLSSSRLSWSASPTSSPRSPQIINLYRVSLFARELSAEPRVLYSYASITISSGAIIGAGNWGGSLRKLEALGLIKLIQRLAFIDIDDNSGGMGYSLGWSHAIGRLARCDGLPAGRGYWSGRCLSLSRLSRGASLHRRWLLLRL